jgi:hypothetical protein
MDNGEEQVPLRPAEERIADAVDRLRLRRQTERRAGLSGNFSYIPLGANSSVFIRSDQDIDFQMAIIPNPSHHHIAPDVIRTSPQETLIQEAWQTARIHMQEAQEAQERESLANIQATLDQKALESAQAQAVLGRSALGSAQAQVVLHQDALAKIQKINEEYKRQITLKNETIKEREKRIIEIHDSASKLIERKDERLGRAKEFIIKAKTKNQNLLIELDIAKKENEALLINSAKEKEDLSFKLLWAERKERENNKNIETLKDMGALQDNYDKVKAELAKTKTNLSKTDAELKKVENLLYSSSEFFFYFGVKMTIFFKFLSSFFRF